MIAFNILVRHSFVVMFLSFKFSESIRISFFPCIIYGHILTSVMFRSSGCIHLVLYMHNRLGQFVLFDNNCCILWCLLAELVECSPKSGDNNTANCSSRLVSQALDSVVTHYTTSVILPALTHHHCIFSRTSLLCWLLICRKSTITGRRFGKSRG